jgi:hypothetical protein
MTQSEFKAQTVVLSSNDKNPFRLWGVARIKDIGTEFVDCLFPTLITKQSEVPQQYQIVS